MTIRFVITNIEHLLQADVLRITLIDPVTKKPLRPSQLVNNQKTCDFIVHSGQSVLIEHGCPRVKDKDRRSS
mgnify:CR=1 FL=1